MKRFVFRLQALLNFRKSLELKSLKHWADQKQELLQIQKKKEVMEQMWKKEQLKEVDSGKFFLQDTQQSYDFVKGLNYRLKEIEQHIVKKESGVKRALSEYMRLKQQVKTLEVLREKQSNIFYKIFKKHTENELDDLSNIRRAFKKSIEMFGFFLFFQCCFAEEPAVENAKEKPAVVKKVEENPKEPVKKKRQGSHASNEELMKDLQAMQEEFHEKERQLDARKIELDAQEAHIQEELKKLTTARTLLNEAVNDKKKTDKEKVSKIVDSLLVMSPKSTSKLLGSLIDEDALEVMAHIEPDRLGKMLGAMETARSKLLSEKFMHYRKKTE